MGSQRQSATGLLQAAVLCLLMLAGRMTPTHAADRPGSAVYPAPNSDAARVRMVLQGGDSQGLAWALERVRRERPVELLPALIDLSQRDELPWPLREAAIAQFLAQLATVEPDGVPPQALDFLRGWQSRTLVPHEESANLGAALFNIAAQTQGLENRWRREQAAATARISLRHSAPSLLQQWSVSSADPAVRAGILDALTDADPELLRVLARATTEAKSERSDPGPTAALAVATAMAAGDHQRMRELVSAASAGELPGLLRALGRMDAGRPSFDLLREHSGDWPKSSTALAIGLWSPHWAGDREAESWLIEQLSDAELGAAAALALARTASDAGRSHLHFLANRSGDARLAARARLALSLTPSERAP